MFNLWRKKTSERLEKAKANHEIAKIRLSNILEKHSDNGELQIKAIAFLELTERAVEEAEIQLIQGGAIQENHYAIHIDFHNMHHKV